MDITVGSAASGGLRAVSTGVVTGCIYVFLAAWIIGAVYFGTKRNGGFSGWLRSSRRAFPARAGLIVGVIVVEAVTRGGRGAFWRHLQYWTPALAWIGMALAIASTALLLWSRWVLGTMWASVPLVQEHHELRTSGPYGLVRHPIYTGLLGLTLGAALTGGFGAWVVLPAVVVPWLLHRVKVEDGLMAGQFGDQYAEYRRRVPALVPRLRPRPPRR